VTKNLLVLDQDNSPDRLKPSAQLGLIDFGQCKRLTKDEQLRIATLILSVANNESDEAIANALRLLNIQTKNDSTHFLAEFARLMFGPFQPQHMDHGWHRKLHEVDKVLYFPNELAMVYRTSLLLRGLAISLQLNPSVAQHWRHHAENVLYQSP
jgi:predicted unusual protein kinase regulating ubiquinone biosynthesis (AarF/ABC1/UbiB family)